MNAEHNRQELDPVTDAGALEDGAETIRADAPEVIAQLDQLISRVGADPESFDGKLVRDLLITGLKLVPDGRDTGELKLMTAALKELRYAYRVFGQYPEPHKVTIFGSARTPEDHPDYQACVEFSRLMAHHNWMVITGAGDGIMKAGHVGPGREASFGVAIRLPFETSANTVIAGDEKLINFRYFFTRKLMFLSQAEAVVNFPGGFGTMDEAYETLTLVQTGKASMIPIVLAQGETEPDGSPRRYWQDFVRFTKDRLLADGMISEEDLSLFHLASSPQDAAEHIMRFYRNYHSSRYVRDDLIIRVRSRLRDEDVAKLNDEFGRLVKKGKIEQRGPYKEESDHLALPRITFTHTRYHYAVVRRLIDRINTFDPVGPEDIED